ncbi:MAG: YgaP-like transmembrane domain [Haloplanus sp.]
MPDACHFQIRRLGGTVVLIGPALGMFASRWFLAVSAFAGVNLLQSSFRDFCPAESFLPDRSGDGGSTGPTTD